MIDLCIEAPGRLACQREAPLDRLPGPGEVRVAVERVSLCGSDYRLFDGSYGGPRRYPLRFGHEWSGRILEVGAGVSARPGTRVTGDCSRWCGACDRCLGDRNLCARIEKFGITCDGFSTARRTIAHQYLYGDRFDLGAEALALVEIVAVAWRGVNKASSNLREAKVLVIGAGPLGLATWLVLERWVGAHRVDLWERDEARLRLVSERFNQRPPIMLAPSWIDVADRNTALTEAGRYDVVFECAGAKDAMSLALVSCAPGGTVVAFGLTRGAPDRFETIIAKGLTIHGAIGGTGAFPEAMAFLAAHRDIPARLVTHRVSALDAEAALAAKAGAGDRIKVQLEF